MTSKYLLAAAIAAVAGPACAQSIGEAAIGPIVLKPLAEARLRYETVDQDGVTREAHALTARVRGGLSATAGRWSVLAEGQGTLALVGRYNDGLNGPANRPIVSDPEDIALYRAQVQYRSPKLVLTGGRQKIQLDDERFIGPVGFRQNGQSFDAARIEATPLKGVKADVSYIWSVRTIWGFQGRGARQQAIGGDTVLANLSYATPIGALTGFAYLVDQDEAAVQGYRLSSQTYGGRLAGSRPLGGNVKLSYQASYARQSDYHRNPNAYRADYWLADGALDVGPARLNIGYEVLGAGKGRSAGATLASLQTPLATLFKFNGWADKFLTTPANGLQDLYGGGGYGWKKVGPFDAIALQATYHRFRSDRASLAYGNEIDLLATAKLGRYAFSARYADYDAKRFATDTRKIWLTAEWML